MVSDAFHPESVRTVRRLFFLWVMEWCLPERDVVELSHMKVLFSPFRVCLCVR